MNLTKCIKKHKERGSATIEAIISFTGFLFVIFTILNVVNFCRAQMLISNAVDTATKEMTQYSYFYKMSGLQKFGDDLANNAQTGKTNLNDVLGTVDDLYSSIGTAVDDGTQHATNLKNAIDEGSFNMENVQNTLAGLKSDGTNIQASINSVMSAFDSVQDNPLMYMKSLVAVAGNESVELLKSHFIAAPLARSFTAKHFGKTTDEADEFLEGLGVVDGLDGMNFNMSTIFSTNEREDVHIVVYYRLKMVQIFGWTTLEVPMCKEAKARAWLGGDDVQKSVEPMVPAAESSDSGESEGDVSDGTSSEDSSVDESSEDESQNGSTDLWALPKRSEDGYSMVQKPAFNDLMGKTYGFEVDQNSPYLIGKQGSNAYACMNLTDADSLLFGMDNNSYVAENAYYKTIETLKNAEDEYNPELDGMHFNCKPGEIKNIVYVVYVPENIPDDVLNDIKSKSENGAENYKAQAKEKLGRDVTVNISFVKAGGNYDYGSEEK